MTRPHDRPKLARLTLDFDTKRAALRGLAAMADESRERVGLLRLSFESGAHAAYLRAVWDGRALAELLELPADELAQSRVDVNTLRSAIAEQERMIELRRRHDALAAEIAPLAALVARMNEYAQGSA